MSICKGFLGTASGLVLLAAGAVGARAQEQADQQTPEESETQLALEDPAPRSLYERIIVTGSVQAAATTGGSATYIGPEQIERFHYDDVNRILRQAPGIYIQEEEGLGLRPNIGIRGSGTDRSGRIALLEDGIPIAPAPYSAASAYYFPSIARISAVEVVKGPAAIKYGPLTTGGAVNLFSTPIPQTPGGRLTLSGGEYETLRAHVYAGGYFEALDGFEAGGVVEYLRDETSGFKELDGGGDTGFEIDDGVFKFALRSDEGAATSHEIEFKLQLSQQESDETYLGLSLDDFRANPHRRYRASQLDNIVVDHELYQLTHRVDFGVGVDLTTTAYHTNTARNWYKLDSVVGATSLQAAVGNPAAFPVAFQNLVGAPGFVGANNTLVVRANKRAYYASGIQTVLGLSFDLGETAHQIEASVRYHEDEEDRFQHNDRYRMEDGQMILTTAGAPGSQDNRVGSAEAWALFIRDTIEWGDFTITPGVRIESIDLKQENYGTADPARTGVNLVVAETDEDVVLPGLSATWQLLDDLMLLAGVHRGFTNPSPGSTVDAETSTNYEAGFRYGEGPLSAEAIWFFSDYDNLVGTCTASTGGGCNIGDQFDGGAVEVRGLEAGVRYDLGEASNLGVGIPLSLTYTVTDAEFLTSFNSSYSPWGNVTAGDELPHLPASQVTLGAGVTTAMWELHVLANYVSETREVAGSGPIPITERIDRRWVVDVAGSIEIYEGVSIFGNVDNVFDEVYNVTFSPAGMRPGKPLTATAGLRIDF